MSDPPTQPGVPAGGASGAPPPVDHSIAKKVEAKVPAKALSVLSTPDRLILRFNKLLNAPGGLSSFLGTFNYFLYLLAHLDAQAAPLKTRLYLLLNRVASTPKVTPAVATGPSHIAALGGMLATTRTTLRLLGLPPLYARARQLMAGPQPGEDQVLYATAVAQCALYSAFQFLENVALLTDAKVLPGSLTAKWTAATEGKAVKIFTWSYRAWMLGVSCDLVRLAREAQLIRATRAARSAAETKDVATQDADVQADQKWWADLVTPLAWMPVAIQFAKWNDVGFPGFNPGIMGACGVAANSGKFTALWDSTTS